MSGLVAGAGAGVTTPSGAGLGGVVRLGAVASRPPNSLLLNELGKAEVLGALGSDTAWGDAFAGVVRPCAAHVELTRRFRRSMVVFKYQ